MTCEACCREFVAKRHRKACPWCQFNNGRGWQPRLDDVNSRVRRQQQDREAMTERRVNANTG